ncbi:GNAT family N-acetyltransferase [Mycolicibacterium pulveris]|uniref:GNAT family N-acetyltransferase n=1 Tax=Mycolicibacterium pulveris TaxID=36813 RepID=UPI003CE8713A
MRLSRVFAAVCIVFGVVFVLVNAGGLPSPWDVAARIAGVALAIAAVARMLLSRAPEENWSGSARTYWVAVAVEVAAIPVGATILTRVLDQPDLVVVWVVFVVGAHFLPARAFGIGRYAELGFVLMLLALISTAGYLIADIGWAPAAGAVLAGAALLGFAAMPSMSRRRSIADHLPRTQGDVTVRRLRHDDADAFAAGTLDPAVRRYGHLPLPEYSPRIVREQIDGVIADGLADGSLGVLAIADGASDEFLGSIVLFDIRETHAEVGFWLRPQARGRGAAQQALVAVAGIAGASGLTQLTARTVPENTGSRRVLEGAGFVQTGEPQQQVTPSGATAAVLTFSRPLN